MVLLLLFFFSVTRHLLLLKWIISIHLFDGEEVEESKSDGYEVEKVLKDGKEHGELEVAVVQFVELAPPIQVACPHNRQNEPERTEHSLRNHVDEEFAGVAGGLGDGLVAVDEGEEGGSVEDADVEEGVQQTDVFDRLALRPHLNYAVQQVEEGDDDDDDGADVQSFG
eukprot:CAMPEP_0202972312 /NCGR_PEP_ID=MMETSP1396-20130829/35317_1 /ASSEMBLY_ACC=CAM_ASM_000872 /TAXON_ID= /ORGANISM="Pseudokeronopsis sp., Strain Brazil" /LENGTH=167 /DNA_ID=CAMNT_0049702579 /DNA_START=92 /DNA_END=595 /DNA_ORIENTATION=-